MYRRHYYSTTYRKEANFASLPSILYQLQERLKGQERNIHHSGRFLIMFYACRVVRMYEPTTRERYVQQYHQQHPIMCQVSFGYILTVSDKFDSFG